MMNPTRFCGALFLFFFSAIAAVLAGQSKPSTPAGQPVNLFREVLDHKGQIQWKAAPPPGIPVDVCLLFKVCEDKGAPKLATLPRATEGGQPVGRGLFLSGTKDPKNPDAVILERQTVSDLYFFLVSPDGKFLVARNRDNKQALYPVSGGEPRTIPGLDDQDRVIRWGTDAQSLYVYHDRERPVKIYKLDLATGHKELAKEIMPADPAGILGPVNVLLTPEGKGYVYAFNRHLTDLYLVKGLR